MNTANEKKQIDPNLVKNAKMASTVFMGLGQIIYLKQFFRGAFYMLAEILMILGLTPVFGCTIQKSINGLITLGSPKPAGTPVRLLDHSIFMMVEGIFVVIIIALFAILYISNIKAAESDASTIVRKGRIPSMKETRNELSLSAFPILGVAPAVVLIAIFTVVPLVFSALVAFTNYSSPDHIPPKNLVDWVGLRNFKDVFFGNKAAVSGDAGSVWPATFARVAVWTVTWATFATLSCFAVGFFFAVVLQDKRIKMPKFYRTIFILPYAIPQMLSLFVWANLLNGTFGPVNRTLQYFGFIEKMIPWMSDPKMARMTLILVNIWIGFPYSMILITSSMTSISQSMYEAAEIDGANKWQQFRSLTFPVVMYQLKPLLIMQFAGNINNFGAVFFLTGGGPALSIGGNNVSIATQAGSTDILISWIYKLTMNSNEYNKASVLSILVFIVLVPFALYNFTRTKSFKDGEM